MHRGDLGEAGEGRLGRPPWSSATGPHVAPWCSRYFSSRPDLFRPPTYLGMRPSPRERPGNTRTSRLLGRSHPPDRGWVVPRVSSERGWGLLLPGSRQGYGSTAAHDFWEHDNRHKLVTELSESGAGDEVIMGIAGHVSRAKARFVKQAVPLLRDGASAACGTSLPRKRASARLGARRAGAGGES